MTPEAKAIGLCRRRFSRQSRFENMPIAAVLVLCSLVFGQQAKSTLGAQPSSFVIVTGAKDIAHYALEGGRTQLSYRIQADYPAQSIIDTIKRSLKERGWSPVRKDPLNPGIPNSLVRGWNYYEDAATEPRTSVRVWQADWRRQRELVMYRLEYRCSDTKCASSRDLHELRIIAIHFPTIQ